MRAGILEVCDLWGARRDSLDTTPEGFLEYNFRLQRRIRCGVRRESKPCDMLDWSTCNRIREVSESALRAVLRFVDSRIPPQATEMSIGPDSPRIR